MKGGRKGGKNGKGMEEDQRSGKRGVNERVRDGEKGRALGKLERGSKEGKKESHLSSQGFSGERDGMILSHVASCWGAAHSSGGEKDSEVFWVALTFVAGQRGWESKESYRAQDSFKST